MYYFEKESFIYIIVLIDFMLEKIGLKDKVIYVY